MSIRIVEFCKLNVNSVLQMMPSADPSNPQYSMIPQLTTQMSTLHLGTGSVSINLPYFLFFSYKFKTSALLCLLLKCVC